MPTSKRRLYRIGQSARPAVAKFFLQSPNVFFVDFNRAVLISPMQSKRGPVVVISKRDAPPVDGVREVSKTMRDRHSVSAGATADRLTRNGVSSSLALGAPQ